jgi:putative flippase GtrA
MRLDLLLKGRRERRELVRFMKFAAVGTLGAIIDYTVLNALVLALGFAKFWANCCSFTAAVLSNFVWNRLWTFPESRVRPLRSQLVQFFIVNLVGLGINQAVFLSADQFLLGPKGLLHSQIGLLASAFGLRHAVLAYNLAKACATVVALFWNFGGNRLWTYRGL